MSSRVEFILRLAKISLSTRQAISFYEENEWIMKSYKISDPAIYQWLSFSQSLLFSSTVEMSGLNEFLRFKTYLVNNTIGLADFSLYFALIPYALDLSTYSQVLRWFELVQSIVSPYSGVQQVAFPRPATLFVFGTGRKHSPEAAAVVVDGKTEKKEKKDKKEVPLPPAAAAATTTAAVAKVEDEEELLDPSKLDIRVGLVVRCWAHEGSDKLLCEEIDLGEGGAPRSIASGIRLHYAASDLQGKTVLVLCNLKERAIAGFKSNGMVLCACNPDHSVVKLLVPPAGFTQFVVD